MVEALVRQVLQEQCEPALLVALARSTDTSHTSLLIWSDSQRGAGQRGYAKARAKVQEIQRALDKVCVSVN